MSKQPTLRTINWKTHSYQGSWKRRHVTADDGKTTLCGIDIPKDPWMTGDGLNKARCRNCEKLVVDHVMGEAGRHG